MCSLTDSEYSAVCEMASQAEHERLKTFIESLSSSQGRHLGAESLSPGRTRRSSPLILAAQHGCLEVVDHLLNKVPHQGDFIDQTATIKFPWGSELHHCTALNAASISGHLDIVRLLLQASASHGITDCVGSTPFSEATFHGHLNIMQCLYENGADINAVNVFGWSPLHVAVSEGKLEIVKSLLLEMRADASLTTPEGYTPMHVAAAKGRVGVVKLLLKEGFSPLHCVAAPLKSDYIPCPVFLAAASGYISVVNELMKPHPQYPTCSPSCKCDAWSLLGVNNIEHGLTTVTYWKKAFAYLQINREAISPEYLAPIAAYGNRTEARSLESLGSDVDLLYQALMVRERCMGSRDPQLFWSLTETAGKLVEKHLYYEAELLLLRAVDLAEKYRFPDLEKGYVLPQTIESEVGRWIEKSLAGDLVVGIDNFTPRFDRYIKFAWKLLKAIQTRVQFLQSTYGCEQTVPKYLLEGILLLFHVWLYHNSKPLHCDSESVRKCEELGREFTTEQLHIRDGSTLLHLAIISEKDLYFFKAVSSNLQALVQSYTRWSRRSNGEPLLLTALLQWGASEAINSPEVANGDRPLHLAVRKNDRADSLLTTLLSYGAHHDAVNREGKTAYELCRSKATDTITALLSPSVPLPLACQASYRVLADGIPYKELSIPPRLKAFIRLHDKSDP